MIDTVRRLYGHLRWADEKLIATLRSSSNAEAWREYNHILAAEKIWIDRLQAGQSGPDVWPTYTPDQADALRVELAARFDAFIASLDERNVDRSISYANTKGQRFESPASDILIHVALHGQYHRGKVNLLLRQGGEDPAPTDYIAFVRGVPAASTRPS